MPRSNRLEDRIRSLSEDLVKAEGEDFHRIASELQTALSEHVERMRLKLSLYPLSGDRRTPSDKKR